MKKTNIVKKIMLAAYGIQAKLMTVREHNEQQMADTVVAALSDGLIVAQVSDAGLRARSVSKPVRSGTGR